MEYIKLDVTCGLCRANGHKRHRCPLRKDPEGRTRCEPGSKKYNENMIQFLENEVKEMKDQIDMIKSEIELKKYLIEVYLSKAREAAAKLVSESSLKETSKDISMKPPIRTFQHQS